MQSGPGERQLEQVSSSKQRSLPTESRSAREHQLALSRVAIQMKAYPWDATDAAGVK